MPEKPSKIWLLSQVRRAGHDDQKAVCEWLDRKFNKKRQAGGNRLAPREVRNPDMRTRLNTTP